MFPDKASDIYRFGWPGGTYFLSDHRVLDGSTQIFPWPGDTDFALRVDVLPSPFPSNYFLFRRKHELFFGQKRKGTDVISLQLD
jgi:hypothetical protein